MKLLHDLVSGPATRVRMAGVLALAACLLLAGSPASASSVGLVPDDGCLVYSGVVFCDNDLRSAGTGVIDPFLRTAGGGSEPVTSGWNTDADGNTWTQPNMADASQTTALAVGDIGTVTVGGTTYWTFLVDVNQVGSLNDDGDLIDLTHLQLYSCLTDSYTNLVGCSSFFNLFGGTITYDDSSKERPVISDSTWITFDYRHNSSGSGEGDIIVYIPTSTLFPTTGYVAMLDGWGSPPGIYGDNDGFQEWINIQGIVCPTCDNVAGGAATPEPSSMLLLGAGLAVIARRIHRKKRA